MNRRQRTMPTARPKSFLSQRIKRDVNYSPSFRTFSGMEGATESGDQYILRKIREFSNIAHTPSETLQLVSLLRPAYQMKKVIDKADMVGALNRLQELQQLERVPLALRDQLQTIQDYVKTLSSEKKNEILIDLQNNENPFPEFSDLDLDDVKRVVAPLYTKDDIMALYERVPYNAPEEEQPDQTTFDLEQEIQDMVAMAKLPEPLPYSEVGMEEEGMVEEGEDGSETFASVGTTVPRAGRQSEEPLIAGRFSGSDLEGMNITQLKRIAQTVRLPYWNKYGEKQSFPLGRTDLIGAILQHQEGIFVDRSPAKVREMRRIAMQESPGFRSQLQGEVIGKMKASQEGEGVSDVIGNVLNKLMPKALKDKIFSTFVEKPVKKIFSRPQQYR